jgi:hypothetical protein
MSLAGPAHTDDDVAARYARPARRGARVVWAVVGVVLALASFTAVTANVLDTDVRWRDISFDVVDDELVQVRFEVYGEEGESVRCLVRAGDARYNDVGQVEVDLGPLPARGQAATVDVRTVAPASSASVRTCVLLP